jgi:hypothetical protein
MEWQIFLQGSVMSSMADEELLKKYNGEWLLQSNKSPTTTTTITNIPTKWSVVITVKHILLVTCFSGHLYCQTIT